MTDNLVLHTDLYQINMMQVYFEQGISERNSVFEVYFRDMPFKNGYVVFAGLERVVEYLRDLHFGVDDITYLRELGYPENFLLYSYSYFTSSDSHAFYHIIERSLCFL